MNVYGVECIVLSFPPPDMPLLSFPFYYSEDNVQLGKRLKKVFQKRAPLRMMHRTYLMVHLDFERSGDSNE